MKKHILHYKKKFRNLSRKKKIIGGIALAVLLLLGYLWLSPKATVKQFITVTQGPIAEVVSVTGNTSPVSSVSLGFGSAGIIRQVHASVGSTVKKGQLLASLDSSDLQAQIKQAQANLAAKVAEGENIAVNVEEVKKQQDALVHNAYRTLLSTDLQASPNDPADTTPPPAISGTYEGPEGEYIIHMYPSTSASGAAFYLTGLETGSSQATANLTPLGTRGLYIQFDNDSLLQYGQSTWTVAIPNTKSSSYVANKNNYLAAQANREKALADAQAQIESASQGSTVSQAQIASARAALQSALAKLQNFQIVSPIGGVVTQFDAKVGQYASPGSPLVSIISDGQFEVEALISETDVGKVAVGNKVTMTIDAFPNEQFKGSVYYIDPAQTTTEGVVGYKIKTRFDAPDSRIKSGLTANIDIETRRKENVLILPQYAILQNDNGTFVRVADGKGTKDIPVVLGLQDPQGNVEISSGVQKDQEVLNVGLKQK